MRTRVRRGSRREAFHAPVPPRRVRACAAASATASAGSARARSSNGCDASSSNAPRAKMMSQRADSQSPAKSSPAPPPRVLAGRAHDGGSDHAARQRTRTPPEGDARDDRRGEDHHTPACSAARITSSAASSAPSRPRCSASTNSAESDSAIASRRSPSSERYVRAPPRRRQQTGQCRPRSRLQTPRFPAGRRMRDLARFERAGEKHHGGIGRFCRAFRAPTPASWSTRSIAERSEGVSMSRGAMA